MKMKIALPALAALATVLGCATLDMTGGMGTTGGSTDGKAIATRPVATDYKAPAGAKIEKAIFAGGCFWGTEFHFRTVPGVTATAVGYIGGKTENPTYQQVCYENTGHAEAVLLEFDPAKISYKELVKDFFEFHNPTTLNRQGPDYGDQYRSEIFYTTDAQKTIAETVILESKDRFNRPIVTKVTKAPTFYFAENYHQQYAAKTGKASCPIDRSAHIGGN